MEAQGGRKVLGTVLGVVAGLMVAVLLQQAGVLPLDRVSAFGLPGLVGALVLGALVARAGFARAAAEWVAIIIVVVLLIMAATGLPALAASGEQGGSTGYLDGGCTVEAMSDLDTTSVTDTSRSDPFDVDPDGTVSWEASSDGAIMNHTWEIWVDVAGFSVTIAEGGDENDGGDTDNAGSEPVRPYADEVAAEIGGDLVGLFLVGGDIAGDGGACDGQAWLRIEGNPLGNLVGQVALGLLVLLLIIIVIIIARTGRRTVEVLRGDGDDTPPPDLGAMQ